MMRIEHVALWTADLKGMKDFYVEYFGGIVGKKYVNRKTGFESYFIEFDSGARLEIMSKPTVAVGSGEIQQECTGYAHIAFSVGNRKRVDEFTHQLRMNGIKVVSEPRLTGDGYYESAVLDPDRNRVEITE